MTLHTIAPAQRARWSHARRMALVMQLLTEDARLDALVRRLQPVIHRVADHVGERIGEFLDDLLLLHAGEALQLEFDDGLRLAFGKLELRYQSVTSFLGRLRSADQFDHFIQVIERLLKAEQQVLAVASLA